MPRESTIGICFSLDVASDVDPDEHEKRVIAEVANVIKNFPKLHVINGNVQLHCALFAGPSEVVREITELLDCGNTDAWEEVDEEDHAILF